jgi:hypothetical protein
MVLVFYRCCLFNYFILFLFDNGDTKCFSCYKSFFGIFPFLLYLQAEGRSIFTAMLGCYRFYNLHVFVPDNGSHFIRRFLRSKKDSLM